VTYAAERKNGKKGANSNNKYTNHQTLA
jgi:hypothetical protein